MAIGVTEAVAEVASTANATSYAMGAFTPAADSTLVVMVAGIATVAAAPTMTGGSLTWTLEVADLAVGGSVDSQYMFWANTGASPGSTTITFDCTGDAATGCFMTCHQFTGSDVNAASPIRQTVVSNSGGVAVADPSATFASALLTGNGYCAMSVCARNPFVAAPPSGWTEDADTGIATPDRGMTSAFRAGGETGTVITFTATSVVWAMMAAEVKEAGAVVAPKRMSLLGVG